MKRLIFLLMFFTFLFAQGKAQIPPNVIDDFGFTVSAYPAHPEINTGVNFILVLTDFYTTEFPVPGNCSVVIEGYGIYITGSFYNASGYDPGFYTNITSPGMKYVKITCVFVPDDGGPEVTSVKYQNVEFYP